MKMNGKFSERIRAYCGLYLHLFQHLFGTETAAQIFANRTMNTRIYEEVYLSFLSFVQTSVLNAADRRKQKLATIGANRQQKRAQKKRAKK